LYLRFIMEAEEPIVSYSQLNPEGSYTYWDYLKWQFTDRVELIRGKIFKMSPGPNVSHQRVSRKLSLVIFSLFDNKPCEAFDAPFDVRLPIPNEKKDTTVVQPDFCIICDASKLDNGRACNGAPDLVMEILSPGNSKHEMQTKFNLYQESGVKEYWIISSAEKTIWIYVLVNGSYIGLAPFVEDMMAEGRLFPELKIAVTDIFHKVD